MLCQELAAANFLAIIDANAKFDLEPDLGLDVNISRSAKAEAMAAVVRACTQAHIASRRNIGVSDLRKVLQTSPTPIPAVYLFQLGRAKDLRKDIDIPNTFGDSGIVFKYGMTNDLKRRAQEHDKTYGRIPSIDMRLRHQVYVDTSCLRHAEREVENFFKRNGWHMSNHPRYTELAIVPDEHTNMALLCAEYARVGKHYTAQLSQMYLANTCAQKEVEMLERLLKEKDAVIDLYKSITNNSSRAMDAIIISNNIKRV